MEENKVCHECGCTDEELINVNGEWLCQDCIDNLNLVQCPECGAWFDEDDLVNCDGDYYCEDCAEHNGFLECSDCGEWHDCDDMTELPNGDVVCSSCLDWSCTYCEACEEWAPNEDVHDLFEIVYGIARPARGCVCDECIEYSGDFFRCDDCGRVFRTDDRNESLSDYGDYCEICAEEHLDEIEEENEEGELIMPNNYEPDFVSRTDLDTIIHGYGYKPRAEILSRHGESELRRKFGLELEVDHGEWSAREPVAKSITDLTNRVYIKYDGSLSSGFEIVSHPGTLAHHMYEMPWRGICSKATKGGFTSHDAGTCGLHIHVGRKELGASDTDVNDTIRKIKVLLYLHWDEVVRFTRRSSYEIDRWACRPRMPADFRRDMNIDREWAYRHIRVHNDHDSRYTALNCENNATIEFRIFRGTLKRDTLIASIQFCDNFVAYAMEHDWNEVMHSNFYEVARYKGYNELDGYLAFRGLAPLPEERAQNSQRTPSFAGVA